MFSASLNNNETFNSSLDLGMFSDVGVSCDLINSRDRFNEDSFQIPVELPPIPKVDNDTIVMIIEQLLMLLLIIGRWMLPKVWKT